MDLSECPNCHQVTLDSEAGICRSCGMGCTEDFTVDERALAGLLRNVQLHLFDMQPHQFQQMAGIFSQRAGHDELEDGIPFSEETCNLTHEYLVRHGIHCIRTDLIANRRVQISLVIAPAEEGIERGIRAARKLARQQRAILKIIEEPKDG
jgi:hypothetical protein